MSLKVAIEERKKGHFTVALQGRLDTVTTPDFEKKVAVLFAPTTTSVCFDFEKLDYISSVGLRAILVVRKAVAGHKGRVVMIKVQAPVGKVLELADILPKTDLFNNLAEADDFLDVVQRKELLKNSDIAG